MTQCLIHTLKAYLPLDMALLLHLVLYKLHFICPSNHSYSMVKWNLFVSSLVLSLFWHSFLIMVINACTGCELCEEIYFIHSRKNSQPNKCIVL